MGKTIPVDQLASTIMEGLEEYADLINEDMKADVKKAAEEKFKSVQSAYEQIKKERGMK